MRQTSRLLAAIGLILITSSSLPNPPLLAQSSTTITVDSTQTFQTMNGFGVNANSGSWKNGQLRPALDLLVDQLGATVWRVVVEMSDWETTNDNSDPTVMNWTYYNSVYTDPQFESLWSTIAYLNQKGITSGLVVSVMGQVPGWMGASKINTSSEDEWVETIASMVYYGRVTRGLQFSMLSPLNEPDWDGIEGAQVDQYQYVRLLHKLSQRLDTLGLTDIRFVGPDTAQIGTGVSGYMPQLMTDATVMSKLDHFGFHNYAGDSGGADNAIKRSAYASRNFWITEVTNIWDILTHLPQGPASALVWDAYDSVYNHAILAGRGTAPPNDAGNGPALLAYNTSTGIYTPRRGFYECAQLFKFVGPGASRIKATSSSSSLTVVAFNDPSRGRVTIVGRNASTGSRTLTGTLTGLSGVTALQLYQTTASSNMQRGADVVVSNGTFSAQVSGNGVFTLTATTVPDTVPPAVTVSDPLDGATVSGTIQVAATTSDNVGVAGVQFLLDGNLLGSEDTTSPFALQWDTRATASGPHQLSARARDAAGNVTTASAIAITVDNTDTTAANDLDHRAE